tara:strand:- start:613 stop:861 length:249 start_codon:yes stop_codon:yes gene_type:complete
MENSNKIAISENSVWYFENEESNKRGMNGTWREYQIQGRGASTPCPFCDDMIEGSAVELAGKFSLMHGKHLRRVKFIPKLTR